MSTAQCQQNYDSAIARSPPTHFPNTHEPSADHDQAACKARFPPSKRGPDPGRTSKRQDAGASADMFSMVDRDGSGNITLEDYVQFVNYKYPKTKESQLLLTDWIAYFHR
jgi:hypothetical protein